MESRTLKHSNIKVIFFGVFLTVNFFTPKFMIFRWYLLSFGSSARNLENKLNTCGSKLNFRLVSMSDTKKIYLKGDLTQNFNTMDLVNFFEKKIKNFTSKMTSCKTMNKKKSETPRFYGQNKLVS
jgi:hypothetical protein